MKMWMSVKEITDVNMAAKIFLVAIDAAAHKDISSITSGISVLMKMNAQILVFVAQLHATTLLEATNVGVPLGSLTISSQAHAVMSMNAPLLRTPAITAVPILKADTFVAALRDITEQGKDTVSQVWGSVKASIYQ